MSMAWWRRARPRRQLRAPRKTELPRDCRSGDASDRMPPRRQHLGFSSTRTVPMPRRPPGRPDMEMPEPPGRAIAAAGIANETGDGGEPRAVANAQELGRGRRSRLAGDQAIDEPEAFGASLGCERVRTRTRKPDWPSDEHAPFRPGSPAQPRR